MKKRYFPVLFFVLFCLSSCLDIEEHFDFKQDGSCKVTYGFDMSSAISVLTNLMTDSIKETPQFSLAKDTTLNFYSALPDTTQQKLNPEEIKMAKESDLAINMNLKKNIMKVNVIHTAQNSEELEYYLKHSQ